MTVMAPARFGPTELASALGLFEPTEEQAAVIAAPPGPLVVIAGQEYGTGSSRDWAAKGTQLLGVKVVAAQSFERIHRSNLVGMGVLPLQFLEGQNRESLGLTGFETFAIEGIVQAVDSSGKTKARLTATQDGKSKTFEAVVRIDTPQESEYYRSGGILPYVLRQLVS